MLLARSTASRGVRALAQTLQVHNTSGDCCPSHTSMTNVARLYEASDIEAKSGDESFSKDPWTGRTGKRGAYGYNTSGSQSATIKILFSTSGLQHLSPKISPKRVSTELVVFKISTQTI